MVQLDVNGTIYRVEFGMGAIKRFCQTREEPLTLEGFFAWLTDMNAQKTLSINTLDDITLLVCSGIYMGCKYEGKSYDIDPDIVFNEITKPGVMNALMLELVGSLPQSDKKKADREKLSK